MLRSKPLRGPGAISRIAVKPTLTRWTPSIRSSPRGRGWPARTARAVSVLVVVGVCQGSSRRGGWVPLLNGVSFEVDAGEVVAIVGGRLSGKTTLLEIAAGIETPEGGSVRLSGHEVTGMPARQRSRLRGRDHELVWL